MRVFHSGIDQKTLKSLLRYDDQSGKFYWRVQRRRAKAGDVAGSTNRLGYCNIRIDGTTYLAHRLAWLYSYGDWPTAFIDHIDGNPSNNALPNLREADHIQNQQNAVHCGYSFKPAARSPKQYEANICVFKRPIYLGRFYTAEEARAAYLSAHEKYFGEFSVVGRRVFK